uniref:G-protein coupled receptors family 3 profile domain-containing protein n=1 Tax=Paramoeba aestuarina TaxID=180227 RepID=A0A7S4PGY8_9EUKA|mmetsp:Transcript_62/g.123  ORF Transcript_62/g.123 Transcript_62/m.123 type:complete len:714 (+) Transcript_62:124-2265(+)
MKGLYLIFATLLFVAVSLCQDENRVCLPDALKKFTKDDKAVLGYSNWDASRLNVEVGRILLKEVGGFDTDIATTNDGSTYDWDGLADGSVDVLFEVWSEGREDEIEPYLKSLEVADIGVLGVLGRNGWFMSSFALDDNEAYASYRPFQRCSEVVPLRSSRTTDPTKGELAGGSPDWILTQGSLQVIENNGLCLEWVWYNSSAYLPIWEQKCQDSEPYLFMYWEPTAVFRRYETISGSIAYNYRLDRITLPRWSQECQDMWDNGYNCDFRASLIGKYMSRRQDMDPELANFYQKFSMDNGDQEIMLGALAYENKDYWEVACEWVLDNRETWSDWFWECENDCFGQGVCNNGTCVCLEGFEGEFCQTKINNKFFVCGDSSTFVDTTGDVFPPDLTNDPAFIKYSLVCDEIIDCDNWADEEENCSPSIVSGTIAFAVLISVSILIVLMSLVVVWVKRERGRIRAAGVEFLTQLHIGVAWGMSSAFLFMGKASDVKCGMTIWWIAVPSALVIGSLVAKQYKVFKVLSHKGFQVIRITNQQLFAITGGIVAVDLIVLIIWSAMSIPYLGIREVDGEDHPLCDTDDFLPFFIVLVAYKFILIFVSAVLAWKSRGLPSAYSEAKHIGFALYNSVILLVFFLLIILLITDEAFLNWILIIVGLWIWFFSIYLIVVGFILAGLWKDRHLDDSEKNALPDVSKSKNSMGRSTSPISHASGVPA